MRLSFEWATRRDGNNGFVLERVPGSSYEREFGPMPPHIVPAFAQARRRYIALIMQTLGASYVMEDPRTMFEDYHAKIDPTILAPEPDPNDLL